MSKIEQIFNANGRQLFEHEKADVAAFNAKYGPRLKPEVATSGTPVTLPLKAFHDSLTALTWTPSTSVEAIAIRPGERVCLQFEEACISLGDQLWREEELEKQELFSGFEDSKNFASELVRALAPRLSPADVENLIAELSAQLPRNSTL